MDALIEELESQDAAIDYDDEEEVQAGAARVVPEELLQTDTRVGLTTAEVANRVKKYGLNQMKGACASVFCACGRALTVSQRSRKT
jgi:H+-transporting ATPase